MTFFPQKIVLGFHHACKAAHEHAPFSREVAENLFLKGVGKRYPDPIAMPRAAVLSFALPVKSWNTAKLELMPLPSRKLARTDRPEPLGATMITSMFLGGSRWSASCRRSKIRVRSTGHPLLEVRLHLRPSRHLACVGEKKHDDGSSLCGFLDREKRLPWHEPVLNRLVPVEGFFFRWPMMTRIHYLSDSVLGRP